jgi:hypothetical protein
MRTASGVQERAESALNRRQFVHSANGHQTRARPLKTDRTLQQLVADLVATRAGGTRAVVT